MAINEEFDRTYVATCRVVEGGIPFHQTLTINQKGLREPFIPADYDEGLLTSDNQDFGVLKQ